METYENKDIDYIADEELLEILKEQLMDLKKQALREKQVIADITSDTLRVMRRINEVSARIDKKNNMFKEKESDKIRTNNK